MNTQRDIQLTVYGIGVVKRTTGIFNTECFKDGVLVGTERALVKNALVPSSVKRVTYIDSSRVAIMISPDGCPSNINSFVWAKMDSHKRLMNHLRAMAEGQKFEYHFI